MPHGWGEGERDDCRVCPLPSPPPPGPCSSLRGWFRNLFQTPGLEKQGCVGGTTKNTGAAGGVLLRPITEAVLLSLDHLCWAESKHLGLEVVRERGHGTRWMLGGEWASMGLACSKAGTQRLWGKKIFSCDPGTRCLSVP